MCSDRSILWLKEKEKDTGTALKSYRSAIRHRTQDFPLWFICTQIMWGRAARQNERWKESNVTTHCSAPVYSWGPGRLGGSPEPRQNGEGSRSKRIFVQDKLGLNEIKSPFSCMNRNKERNDRYSQSPATQNKATTKNWDLLSVPFLNITFL